jgi:hypothetical protein
MRICFPKWCYLSFVMVLITANKAKRLVLVSFTAHVTAEQVRQGENDLRPLLADFTDGFRLLTDMERLESMDDDCGPEIGRMMDVLREAGIERVVRIVSKPEKDIGLNILSVFHYGRKPRPVTCENMVEAARLLKL